MTSRTRARRTIYRTRARRGRLLGLLVVVAALGAALGHGLPVSSSLPAAGLTDVPRSGDRDAGGPHPAARGTAHGEIPDGTTPFDGELPGVARLDPALLGALRRAATDAAASGVTVSVQGGWRSAAYQQQLFREAVSEHGSEAEAARWVATAETSAHVSGDAVDLGPSDAIAWLSEQGAAYGLCQVYANEPWHFELRPEAADGGCPPTYADPTHDPRTQR